MDLQEILIKLFVFGVPILLAVPLHEAAHGFAALYFGDDTAKRAGRLTLNPLRHVDLVGTIALPGLLVLTGAPFLFGYAKPVPVNFTRLNHPRRDMVFVALAGPLTNIFLALVSGLLMHWAAGFEEPYNLLLMKMLEVSISMNVALALFNMLPIPPLDGGRVAVGILPNVLALLLARLEQYGMHILFGLIVIVPMIGQGLGISLNILSWILASPINYTIEWIMRVTGV
jgi:Zn-dependent protease